MRNWFTLVVVGMVTFIILAYLPMQIDEDRKPKRNLLIVAQWDSGLRFRINVNAVVEGYVVPFQLTNDQPSWRYRDPAYGDGPVFVKVTDSDWGTVTCLVYVDDELKVHEVSHSGTVTCKWRV